MGARTVVDLSPADEAMCRCAASGDLPGLLEALAEGARVDRCSNSWGVTPLMDAASRGHADCARALIAAGLSVDSRDHEGDTALMYAAAFGSVEALAWLLDAGARGDERNEDGVTALMDAAMTGSWRCVEVLVASGCDLDIVDDEGMTALMYVVEAMGAKDVAAEDCYKCVGLIGLICQAGGDLEVKDPDGRTALRQASEAGYGAMEAIIVAEMERRELEGTVAGVARRVAAPRI